MSAEKKEKQEAASASASSKMELESKDKKADNEAEESGSESEMEEEEEEIEVDQHLADHFEADMGYLAAFNTNPLQSKVILQGGEKREKYLVETTEANVNLFLQKMCALATEQGSTSTVQLPKPTTKLPRQKPIPAPKPETKWSKFAQEKGIMNKKRERMVWDDETQKWKPRFGYKRINDEQSDWVVEVKHTEDHFVDKFKEKRNKKKMNVLKNRQKQLRNQEANMKKGKMQLPSGIANDLGKGRGAKGQGKGKTRNLEALKAAQTSTASLGRFDQEVVGEPKRKIGSKRRSFQPNEKTSDHARDQKILSRILGKTVGGSSQSASPAAGKNGKRSKKQKRK